MKIIITESQIKKLVESYESAWEIFAEYEQEILQNIMDDVISGVEHEKWRLIPFDRLRRIWNEFSKFKFIRDEKGMEMIREICIANTARLYVNSILVAHTEIRHKEYIEDAGYCFKDPDEEEPEFYDPNQLSLFDDSNGPKEQPYDNCDNHIDMTWDEFEDKLYTYIGYDTYSDYATKPLIELAYELINAKTPEEQLLICDKMFNIVHMRGDIAALYVQGGSRALSQLSGEHVMNENLNLNEGNVTDFHFKKVQDYFQKALNNGSVTLDQISNDRYFVVVTDIFGNPTYGFNARDKKVILDNIKIIKQDGDIWKIYVEKPGVAARVYLRKEYGWVVKDADQLKLF